jgi:hypothetical protein
MSVPSSIDPESFQKLLASVFAVQESKIDPGSLSAILEVQRLIANGKLDVDRIMQEVADRARNVANATGIAIALLQGDQLVYRAGSGSAANYVGRQMTAILISAARKDPRGEILRVEDAETDARIEAAICRQFEAESLVILPIYRERAVAGLLHVLFSEAHTFQEPEMRTYRLMAGLVEEAMSSCVESERKEVREAQAVDVPHAVEKIASQTPQLLSEDRSTRWQERKYRIGELWRVVRAAARDFPDLWQPAEATKEITSPVRWPPRRKMRRSVPLTATVAGLVIVASWIIHDRRQAAPAGAAPAQGSNVATQRMPITAAKALPSDNPAEPQMMPVGAAYVPAAHSAFKRVRVGADEVDYVAEDVTVRRFASKPSPMRLSGRYKEVHFGKDVTVRYFGFSEAPSLDLPVSK